MTSFLVSLIYFLILCRIVLRPDRKKKNPTRAFWISAVFLSVGFLVLALASFEIYLPSPILLIQRLIQAVLH